MVSRLCENGLNVNHQNNQGETALMLACEEERDTLVKIFLSNRADITLKDNDGETAWDRSMFITS